MVCGQAATSAVQQEQPVPTPDYSAGPSIDFNPFDQGNQRSPRKSPIKWIAIGAGALVAVLAATAVIVALENNRYIKPEASPALETSLSPAKVEEAALAMCSTLEGALPSEAAVQALLTRTASIQIYNDGNARRAQKFLNGASWITSAELGDINAALSDASFGALDGVISKTETIRERDRGAFSALWAENFLSKALESCGLQSRLDAAVSAQTRFTAAKKVLVDLVSTVPWYPDGYNEWTEDSSVAWKWVDGRECSYDTYCWHVAVVAESGCPSGVYVEVNIVDSSDNVLDYANGSLSSLGPMQTGIVEIRNSYSATGQVSKLSCHTF